MRASSSAGILAIVLTNAVLLYGLFVLVWSPGTIAFLFWFEAVAIGVAAFARVAASLPGDVPGSGRSVTYQRLPRPGGSSRVSSSVPRVNALLALPLFVLLYGLLLLAYGGLLLAALKEPNYPAVAGTAISSEGVRFAMVLIAGEQLWAFWRGYLRGPAWQRKDPTFHFWQPFGLAIVTWLAFFFGFLMLGWLNSPLVVLAVLIVLKAVAGLCGALIDAQAAQWQRV